MQRQPSSFNDIEFSTLNWAGDSVFDYAFDDYLLLSISHFL